MPERSNPIDFIGGTKWFGKKPHIVWLLNWLQKQFFWVLNWFQTFQKPLLSQVYLIGLGFSGPHQLRLAGAFFNPKSACENFTNWKFLALIKTMLLKLLLIRLMAHSDQKQWSAFYPLSERRSLTFHRHGQVTPSVLHFRWRGFFIVVIFFQTDASSLLVIL